MVGCLCLPAIWAAAANPGASLPRKSADESYAGVTVRYEELRDAAGQRLRLIVTHPAGIQARYPTIFLAGWLSCDSIEAPSGTKDATQLLLQALAKLPGFATVRMEKAGVGDSEGDCAQWDFDSELSAYRLAFVKTREYSFVDGSRIFILGVSNGGGFAPLVAEGAPVKGFVIDGGWSKTWYEHMLEIERRRLTLSGKSPGQVNDLMRSVAMLYSAYLLDGRTPADIFKAQPALKPLWEGAPQQQYGRPIAYYQQLQQLNLQAAWAQVRVPVLALHGEFDWIMSRSDIETIAALVNRNAPGAAEFVELPGTGHTFEHYDSQAAAFAGRALPYDARIGQRIGDWFTSHR